MMLSYFQYLCDAVHPMECQFSIIYAYNIVVMIRPATNPEYNDHDRKFETADDRAVVPQHARL